MKMQAGFAIAISLRTDVSPPSFASVSLGYISSGGHHNGAIKLSEGNQMHMRVKTGSVRGFEIVLNVCFGGIKKSRLNDPD